MRKVVCLICSLQPAHLHVPPQFQFVNTSTEYAVPNSFNNCSQYQTRVAAQQAQLVGASVVSRPTPDEVLVTGRQTARLLVTANQIVSGCALCCVLPSFYRPSSRPLYLTPPNARPSHADSVPLAAVAQHGCSLCVLQVLHRGIGNTHRASAQAWPSADAVWLRVLRRYVEYVSEDSSSICVADQSRGEILKTTVKR